MTEQRKPDSEDSLAGLEARVRRDLEWLTLPPAKDWLEPRVHPQYGPVLDVAIIGAGMAGLSAAFALKCQAVRGLRVFDRAPEGFEGPWATTARMETLRSPPELSGPSFQFASLTFRAWFEAQFGAAEWSKLYRIPRLQWMDYLRWYRRMIDVPVENGTELTGIGGDGELVLLTLRSASGTRKVAARRVALANGRDGLGGSYTPDPFRGLDPRFVMHSLGEIDFSKLRGKTVEVIGAGSTACDCAAEALEHGAAQAAMLVRRADVPRINKSMGIGSAGFWRGFHSLADAQKWEIVNYIDKQGVPAPRNSMLRCSRHENFSILARCAVRAAAVRDGRVLLDTTRGSLAFDRVILATGLAVDWSQRGEFAALKPHVQLWRDHFRPNGSADYAQAEHPYLGAHFEFLPREGAPTWVNRVHCFNYAATMSHGPISGDIPAISMGAERTARGVVNALFAEDHARTWQRLAGWNNPELRGDEYVLDEDVSKFLADEPAEGEHMSTGNPDVMDTLAGLAQDSPFAALRRQRPDVVKHLQGSDDVIFARAERAAAALRVATLLRDPVLSEHYRSRLATLDPDGTLARTVEGGARFTEVRWEAILAQVDLVTRGPGSAERKDIDNLLVAGLSSHAVVSLSQLVAYVNFQSRVLAGLRMLKGAA